MTYQYVYTDAEFVPFNSIDLTKVKKETHWYNNEVDMHQVQLHDEGGVEQHYWTESYAG